MAFFDPTVTKKIFFLTRHSYNSFQDDRLDLPLRILNVTFRNQFILNSKFPFWYNSMYRLRGFRSLGGRDSTIGSGSNMSLMGSTNHSSPPWYCYTCSTAHWTLFPVITFSNTYTLSSITSSTTRYTPCHLGLIILHLPEVIDSHFTHTTTPVPRVPFSD